VAVSLGGGGLFVANAAGGTESSTVLTDPVRVLDSRDPVNVGLNGPFVSATSQKLKITGSIPTNTGTKVVVPSGATGVLLNVTPVGATADGFISIRPGDATGAPSTSSLNFTVGAILPNAVLVALPTVGANAGRIDITFDAYGATGPATDILIDVVGYTTAARLDALQAEIDAVEATNATQQNEIAAKANLAAVNAALIRERVWSAEVGGTGSKFGTGDYTSEKLALGTYQVSWNVTGLGLVAEVPNVVITTQCAGTSAALTSRNTSSSGGFLNSFGVNIAVRNDTGAAIDCNFFVFAKFPDPNIPTPPVAATLTAADESNQVPGLLDGICTTEGDVTTCVKQP